MSHEICNMLVYNTSNHLLELKPHNDCAAEGASTLRSLFHNLILH